MLLTTQTLMFNQPLASRSGKDEILIIPSLTHMLTEQDAPPQGVANGIHLGQAAKLNQIEIMLL